MLGRGNTTETDIEELVVIGVEVVAISGAQEVGEVDEQRTAGNISIQTNS